MTKTRCWEGKWSYDEWKRRPYSERRFFCGRHLMMEAVGDRGMIESESKERVRVRTSKE